jgi:hypothetical protein
VLLVTHEVVHVTLVRPQGLTHLWVGGHACCLRSVENDVLVGQTEAAEAAAVVTIAAVATLLVVSLH